MTITHELKLNNPPLKDKDGVIRTVYWKLESTDGEHTLDGGSGAIEFPDASPNDPGFEPLKKNEDGGWLIPTKLAQEWLEANIDPQVLADAEAWGEQSLAPPTLVEAELV